MALRPLLLVLAVSTACASVPGAPRPAPFPRPATAPPAPPGLPALGPVRAEPDAVIGTALSLRGVPYRFGGSDPSGFDCSGFVQYVFGRHAMPLPRQVPDLFRVGLDVDPGAIAPGDLLFFSTTAPGPSHVAIAIGGDAFVHAPATDGAVRVERIGSPYWAGRFLGARRVVAPDVR